ncbi:hypothetical protein CYLTODRAFT_410822 [Cylindrobasidium torrendii FP15055 ss-10]|uniref:MYND-type domain-containing protein n=1 Tax=Cylindrobasidium torrendii FP15055 ss-10 TaxID=1314674 RepID=A0A0D7BBG7_9AGAR|nr:hypothetical protein CYLTODRAFT_410822 [Cylindrobasidium torrendii FP15055 ss-10]
MVDHLHAMSREEISKTVAQAIQNPDQHLINFLENYRRSLPFAKTTAFHWDLLFPLVEHFMAKVFPTIPTDMPDTEWTKLPVSQRTYAVFRIMVDSLQLRHSPHTLRNLPAPFLRALLSCLPYMQRIYRIEPLAVASDRNCSDILDGVCQVMSYSTKYTNTAAVISKSAPELYPAAFEMWKRLSVFQGERFDEYDLDHNIACCSTVLCHTMLNAVPNSSVDVMLQSRPDEVINILMGTLAYRQDLHRVGRSAPLLSAATSSALLQALDFFAYRKVFAASLRHGFLTIICRALRKLARLEYDRDYSGSARTGVGVNPMRLPNNLLRAAHMSLCGPERVTEALEARLLISVLQIQDAVDNGKMHPAVPDTPEDIKTNCLHIVRRLSPYMVLRLPSLNGLFEKSFRYIDQHCEVGSIVWSDLMRRRHNRPEREVIWACSNAKCPRQDMPRHWKQCTGCRLAEYCSTTCQRGDWRSGHSAQCAQLRTARLNSSVTCPLRSRDTQTLYAFVRAAISAHVARTKDKSAILVEYNDEKLALEITPMSHQMVEQLCIDPNLYSGKEAQNFRAALHANRQNVAVVFALASTEGATDLASKGIAGITNWVDIMNGVYTPRLFSS